MDIKALKKKLALLQQKKAALLQVTAPKKKRGRPPGSKNKKKSSVKKTPSPSKLRRDKTLTQKKRGRPRIHPIKTHAYPDLAGTSLVVRKITTGYVREWVACLGDDVIGYYKSQEDAHKAYLKGANK